MEDQWSKGVHPHEGALRSRGWKENESAERRHAALERSVREDGYARTVERLDFMANVASRRDNAELSRVAAEDRAWLERWERDRRDDEDRKRTRGDRHRVEPYTKADGEHVHAHLARNPRRRR